MPLQDTDPTPSFGGFGLTLRGLDGIEKGQRYRDGWTLTYNLFRGHHSLWDKTPGQVAKVGTPFTEWADVIKDGAVPLVELKPEARPGSRHPRKLPPRIAASLAFPTARARPKPATAKRKPFRKSHPYAKLRRDLQNGQRRRVA